MAVKNVHSGFILQSATAKGTASALFARGTDGNFFYQALNHGGESALWKLEVSFDNSNWVTLETYTALSAGNNAYQTAVNAPYVRGKFGTAYSGSNVTGVISVYIEAGVI